MRTKRFVYEFANWKMRRIEASEECADVKSANIGLIDKIVFYVENGLISINEAMEKIAGIV